LQVTAEQRIMRPLILNADSLNTRRYVFDSSIPRSVPINTFVGARHASP